MKFTRIYSSFLSALSPPPQVAVLTAVVASDACFGPLLTNSLLIKTPCARGTCKGAQLLQKPFGHMSCNPAPLHLRKKMATIFVCLRELTQFFIDYKLKRTRQRRDVDNIHFFTSSECSSARSKNLSSKKSIIFI